MARQLLLSALALKTSAWLRSTHTIQIGISDHIINLFSPARRRDDLGTPHDLEDEEQEEQHCASSEHLDRFGHPSGGRRLPLGAGKRLI